MIDPDLTTLFLSPLEEDLNNKHLPISTKPSLACSEGEPIYDFAWNPFMDSLSTARTWLFELVLTFAQNLKRAFLCQQVKTTQYTYGTHLMAK